MVHIKDGIIAISSDMVLFMLIFNYDDIGETTVEIDGLFSDSDDGERP
jgi:hypothetical protein